MKLMLVSLFLPATAWPLAAAVPKVYAPRATLRAWSQASLAP